MIFQLTSSSRRVLNDADTTRSSAWWPVGTSLILLLCAIALWVNSLAHIPVRNVTDLGLVSVLPVTFFVALGVLTLSFCFLVHLHPSAKLVLLLHLVVLILIFHGTPSIIYEAPRYAWTYKHIGVTDYIQRHGSLDLSTDIYFNWPVFFVLNAFLSQAAGLDSPLAYAAWAPPFFNLLWLGALYLIFTALSDDRRLVWLALWFFFLTSWVGQDYFAPQALAFFLHLVVLGIVLHWLKPKDLRFAAWLQRLLIFPPLAWLFQRFVVDPAARTMQSAPPKRGQTLGIVTLILLIFGAIASSHQLTPFMTIASVVALVVLQRCRLRSLPLLMAGIAIGWIALPAQGYMAQNSGDILGSFGELGSNLNRNLSDLSRYSPDAAFVIEVSGWLNTAVRLLALLGLARRLRQGQWDLTAFALAAVPMPMIIMQSYGGEMVLRIYLFSLPFLAFLAAGLVYPTARAGRSPFVLPATVALSLLFVVALSLAYYGRERMNYFTQDEMAAVYFINETAPSGATVVVGSGNFPMNFADYEKRRYILLSEMPEFHEPKTLDAHLSYLEGLLRNHRNEGAYLMITRGQKDEAELRAALPGTLLLDLEQSVLHSPHFKEVFAKGDARVFMLSDE